MANNADKNIAPEAYIPAESELANQDLDRSIDDVCLPLTSNLVAGVLQGDVVFQFSTGQDEYIQLPKTFLGVDYGVIADNAAVDAIDIVDKALAPCLWQNARFEIEGQRVATSNNYTTDWAISNRLQYSADHNKAVNDIRYIDINALAAVEEVAGVAAVYNRYTSYDNLAALFYRTENMLLPPNTHYKLTLTPEAYEQYKQKSSYKDTRVAGAQRLEIFIYRMYLNLHRIRRSTKPVGDYTLKFMNIESNMSTPTAASHNIQYQVSSKMRKCGVVMVSTAARTEAAAKLYSPIRFRYATDLTAAAKQQGWVAGVGTGLYKLQFKSGALLMPNSIYNIDATGLKEVYLHYLNSVGKYNDAGAPETFAEWLMQGPIYVEDAVKSPLDLSTNLQIEMTFQATPAANVYTFQINETILSWTWTGPQDSIPVFTNLSV